MVEIEKCQLRLALSFLHMHKFFLFFFIMHPEMVFDAPDTGLINPDSEEHCSEFITAAW